MAAELDTGYKAHLGMHTPLLDVLYLLRFACFTIRLPTGFNLLVCDAIILYLGSISTANNENIQHIHRHLLTLLSN